MSLRYILLALTGWTLVSMSAFAADPKIKLLIIDGQNNHNWKESTPLLKEIFEKAGIFDVSIATAPPGDTKGFAPKFSDYQVIVSNYNGKDWPAETQKAFEEYVRNGGGFVSVHAADNSFGDWPEYNTMIGVGGWGGRKPTEGAYLRIKGSNFVRDTDKGDRVGSHGAQHEFLMTTRAAEHPIMKGLPEKWMHGKDELYDRLRGPAKNVTVLASAFSEKSKGGSGVDEPLLMVIDYGKGRVFHTALGHGKEAILCAGFATTLTRGAEWVATGKVTQEVPTNFPTAEKSSNWK
ncbi:ThuA domain-containing protein [Telmatocola sphagniphila]|uniref:ThuA domain-containing protein n=1 Tax=Telmatocola sphagniphila TaxID=1123043 RepID=A0A8E6B4A5_9BACT|nr:ThuA domain-containing protein [Telmatocola sphagniphila]QVL31044.1 ThuA domain-containing protein [Telmatocola sphagniphila]